MNNKHGVTILLTMTAVSLILLYVVYQSIGPEKNANFPTVRKTILSKIMVLPDRDRETRSEPKLILFWTTYTGQAHGLHFLNQCPEMNCRLTNNRSDENRSAAILFHIGEFHWRDRPLHRQPWQRYVFELYESPHHTHADLDLLDDYFNWTMTFRLDSDIYAPYGYIVKKPGDNLTYINKELSSLSSSKIVIDRAKILDFNKKPIVWVVSNCFTPSKREDYVEELSKYIQVDIYGRCSRSDDLKCPTTTSDAECNKIIGQKYRFYLAFENSLCKNYITEKYYSRAVLNAIPIVLKRKIVEDLLPKHSFIAADDFGHPKQLAEYLHKLLANDTAYLSYFWWKLDVLDVESRWPPHYSQYCRLCEKLWSETEPKTKVRRKLGQWWHDDAHCDVNLVRGLLNNETSLKIE